MKTGKQQTTTKNFTCSNWKQTTAAELEGLRVGGGVEANLFGPVYGKVEYRYTDFDGGIGQHGGLVGLGVRF